MIPKNAKKLSHRILREGEHTGHCHTATSDDVELYDCGDSVLYAKVPTGTEITHQEHNIVMLPPADYLVGGVREYDHLLEESREVVD